MEEKLIKKLPGWEKMNHFIILYFFSWLKKISRLCGVEGAKISVL